MSAVAPSRPHFQRRFVGVPPVLRASGMATRGSWSSHDHRCLHASVDSLILPSVPRYLRRRRRGFSAPRLPIDAAIQLSAPLFAAIAAAAVASVAAAPAASVAVTAASVVAAAATAAAVATVAPVAAAAVAVVVADTAGVPVVTAAAAYVDGAAAVATSAAVAIGNFCRGCCRCRCRRRRPLSCPSQWPVVPLPPWPRSAPPSRWTARVTVVARAFVAAASVAVTGMLACQSRRAARLAQKKCESREISALNVLAWYVYRFSAGGRTRLFDSVNSVCS